jgi:predicted O-methyltransferase YrrM
MSFINTIKGKILRIVYKSVYPNGHYYSPIPNTDEIRINEKSIFELTKVADVKLYTEEQINFLKSSLALYHKYPFKESPGPHHRYYHGNPFFNATDGLALYFVLNSFQPKRILEVGSGFSSALMLDTSELEFEVKPDFTFIDPFTERLESLLRPQDRSHCTIIKSPVQQVPLNEFQKLQSGDLLFIDSSHISKVGSDLNYLLFHVLPVLEDGVIIHFHDICYPFEYPKEWVYNGIFWNEAYLLRAFLMNNDRYRILLFNHYMGSTHNDWLRANMPLFTSGGSLYLRKQ